MESAQPQAWDFLKAICLLSFTQNWPLANQCADLVIFSTLFPAAGCRGNFPKGKDAMCSVPADRSPPFDSRLKPTATGCSLTPTTSLGPSNVTKSILLGWKPALVTTSYSQSIKSDCPKDSSICVGLWCFIQTWKKCTAARVWRCSFAFCLPKVPPILPPSKAIFAKLLVSFISIETGQNHSNESYWISETNTVSLSYMSEYFIIHIWIFRTAVTHYSSVSILSYPR